MAGAPVPVGLQAGRTQALDHGSLDAPPGFPLRPVALPGRSAGPCAFNRPRAVVAACGLILGQTERELEHSDDPSDYAARCGVCRALGPIPLVRR